MTPQGLSILVDAVLDDIDPDRTLFGHVPVVVVNRSTTRRLATCFYRPHRIVVYPLALKELPIQVEDTIRHEFAHSNVWQEHRKGGHGPLWRDACYRLGAYPSASMVSTWELDRYHRAHNVKPAAQRLGLAL